MRKYVSMLVAFVGVALLLVVAEAQPPGEKQGKDKDFSNSPVVTGMMAFDKKKTGKLTKDMVTDPRLHRLFDRADTNKDGVVTREELMVLAAKIELEFPSTGGKGKGKGDFGKDKKGKKKKDFD